MRALAILAAICLSLLATAGVAVDIFYFGPLRISDERIAVLSDQLNALRARERGVREALTALPIETGEADTIVESSSDVATELAHFQQSARDSVAAVGGEATSSQALQSDLGNGLTKLSVLLRGRFDEKGLMNFLRTAESAEPIILVDSLDVRLTPISGSPQPLDVTATLVKFHADVATP